jgi:cobalt-zinc-cadmium efflux system protein
MVTDWVIIDPILSLLIVVLILYSTYHLIVEAIQGLMAGVPSGLSLETVGREMASVKDVVSVHDLHIWSLTSKKAALSAHVVIDDLNQWPVVWEALCNRLKQSYEIEHVTLQPESNNKNYFF